MKSTKNSKALGLGLFWMFLAYFIILPSRVTLADENYPTKSIKFVVGMGPSGISDAICRRLAEVVGKSMGQDVVVENKEGGGGLVAASFLSKAKPDGYTIGAFPSSIFNITPFYTKMDFDPLTSFFPIVQTFSGNQLLVASAGSPLKTVEDLVREGRKRRVTFAVTGLNTSDIAVRRLALETKSDLKTIPFGGGGSTAVLAAIGRQTDGFAGGAVYEFVRAGKVQLIARLTDEARGVYKDVPSLKDLGYDINAAAFLGVFAPSGVPENVQRKLDEEFNRAIFDPFIKTIVEKFGDSFLPKNSKEFSKYLKVIYEQSKKEFMQLELGIYSKDKK